ncbi:unnamed protein product [Peronospora farinosa]|uniref:Uncharacterized protein n=1 Tax=Peronospora farinosa TaxID=134698 RepID=A0ABN8CIY2_9STRA|nr:unnamed protein product [Peronospora farinosa]
MADVTAVEKEQDINGWYEIEETLTALDLPPVPPTSDPQRLLGYVLHILPRYTEMEMLATHLWLYASTLEKDMEQVKSHIRLLTREATGEREKKRFLERYAAQVVKERNDLLHSRGSSKKKTATSSHFVWHSCCKKNAHHAMDLAPSIVAFRGEKLQEATKQVESLQDEVHNHELLRRELDFLLKKTQREHDSKVAADCKHIQQLEKQILQRSSLHSNLERKLYEVESMLARHEGSKEEELGIVCNRMKEAKARIDKLEKENSRLQEQLKTFDDDRDRLKVLLEETTESKNVFAKNIDTLSEKCHSLESEVESLRSEIKMLQSTDINDIRAQYATRINRLQKDSAVSKENLRQEIDRLKQDLKKRDESPTQEVSVRQSSTRGSSRRALSSLTSGLESIPHSGDDSKWSDGIFDDDRQLMSDGMRSSFPRNELSESDESFGSSSLSGESRLNQVDADNHSFDNQSFSMQSYKKHSPRQSYVSSSKQGYSRELEAVSRDLSTSSKDSDAQTHENDPDINASNEPFDWETFIDNASEISTFQDEHRKRSPSTIARHLDLNTSIIRHDNSFLRMSGSRLKASSLARMDTFVGEQQQAGEENCHFSNAIDSVLLFNQSLAEPELDCDEEEKESNKDDLLVDNKQEQRDSRIVDTRVKQEQREESAMEEEHGQNKLARDLYQMLNGIEQKRKEEEQKASQAEQALLEFQQLQQGLQALQISPVLPDESS